MHAFASDKPSERAATWRAQDLTIKDVEVTNALPRLQRVGLDQLVSIGEEHANAALHNNIDASGAAITCFKKDSVRWYMHGRGGLCHFAGVFKLQARKKFGGHEELWDVQAARSPGISRDHQADTAGEMIAHGVCPRT